MRDLSEELREIADNADSTYRFTICRKISQKLEFTGKQGNQKTFAENARAFHVHMNRPELKAVPCFTLEGGETQLARERLRSGRR
jgi:hypothetical protein